MPPPNGTGGGGGGGGDKKWQIKLIQAAQSLGQNLIAWKRYLERTCEGIVVLIGNIMKVAMVGIGGSRICEGCTLAMRRMPLEVSFELCKSRVDNGSRFPAKG